MDILIRRKDAIDKIFEVYEYEFPKWIPVTEALPEEETNVLVTVHFDGFKNAYTNIPPSDYVDIACQTDGYWASLSDGYKVYESSHHVIAWRPLPKPMKMNNE